MMPSGAIAKACIRAGVPFTCWKFVTDLADENATAEPDAATGARMFEIRAGVPFTCWKFVTDLADENATANWRENVEKGAAAFIALVESGGLEP